MTCFALYRLPDQETATRITSSKSPILMQSCNELNGQQGFVVAPFTPSPHTPILLIEAESVETFTPAQPTARPIGIAKEHDNREEYACHFNLYHEQIAMGHFEKIVLARGCRVEMHEQPHVEDLFNRACRLYPHMFVALVHTPECGTWLTATPEVLLQGHGKQWSTAALAGTMPCQEKNTPQWSNKNIAEQQLVTTYIAQCLHNWGTHIEQNGPHTVQAGALLHLKTTFNFTLNDALHVGNLLDELYPTPAVCGTPKEATREFIMAHEGAARQYYSGFMGPLSLSDHTHLYVSLRCMKIEQNRCLLYAGGGLLPDSNEQEEWNETQAKMETMLKLLKTTD